MQAFWSFKGIPFFLSTTVVTTSKCGWKSHSVTQSNCDAISAQKVFQTSYLLLHDAGAGLFHECKWGLFFLPLVLTHVHHVGLLGFMINRWIIILYLHCNIFCWFDGKQKDTGEKGSRESIYRAKNEQPEKHKSAALYSESIHSRIRPQAVLLNPLCLPYDTHFHVSNYWGPATHMRSHNSWSMPLVIISTVLVALSFNTASALCQGIFGVELDYVCFCTSLQGPFHTSECYSRSWLSLGKERRYRCAWVALGPRVDDGDGCAGTCGDVFPHLHRQKSYNHQHFISLFIHTHVCSSHLRTSLTLILTSTKTTYKKAVKKKERKEISNQNFQAFTKYHDSKRSKPQPVSEKDGWECFHFTLFAVWFPETLTLLRWEVFLRKLWPILNRQV